MKWPGLVLSVVDVDFFLIFFFKVHLDFFSLDI